MLDDLQRRHGSHGQHLVGTLQGLHHHILRKVLGHALPHQQQSAHQGEGQQHTGGDADQIGKEVAHIVLRLPGQAPDKGHAGGIAAGRRDEHHEDDDQHLGEIAQAALTGVVLKVGVGHEADDGVEGQRGLHAPDPIGIEEGDALDAEHEVADGDHHRVGADQGHGVLLPVHTLAGVHPAQFIDHSVHPVKHRIGEGVFSRGDMIEIPPHRNDKDQIDDQCQNQLQHMKLLLYCVLCVRSAPDAPGRRPDIRPAAPR